MNKGDYRLRLDFTDGYFDWLESQQLLCPDDTVQGWQCNYLWLSIPAVCAGDESEARDFIGYAQQRYPGNYGEVWWMGEVIGTKKRDAYTLPRAYVQSLMEGIFQLCRAREAVQNRDNDRALIFLCNAGSGIGQANGFRLSVKDNARKGTRAGRHAANASHKAHATAKQTARAWYAAHKMMANNKTMTKDAAAQKMHDEHVVSASFRTIRGYLTGL